MEIRRYDLISYRSFSGFVLLVNDKIKKGWVPFGSVMFCSDSGYCQPMVSYTYDDEE
jgi:hypothetical protein